MKKIKEIWATVRDRYYIAGASRTANFVWAAVKFIAGVYSLSFFLIISGMYTLAVGFTKMLYLKGRKDACDETAKETGYYLKMCVILAVASLLYIAYMIRHFIVPPSYNYGDVFAIMFAAMAFTELGFAIAGLVKSNRKNDLLLSGLKSVNLASALTALSFTQVAILSFTATDWDASFYNGLGGIIFGGGCLIICLFMLIKYFSVTKKLKNTPGKAKNSMIL